MHADVPSGSAGIPRPGARPAVSAIVPARNEAGRVGETVRALRLIPDVVEVIVVDDGSLDATAAEAAAAGARVIRPAARRRRGRARGKGAALSAGIDAAASPLLVFCDADLGATAAEAAHLISPVARGKADMTIGRLPDGGGPSGFGLVERSARTAIRLMAGERMGSPLSGQRALARSTLEHVRPLAGGFGVDAALTIDALRAGCRVIEVPVAMSHARTGRTLRGFAHRARQGLHLLRALASRIR